MDGTSQNVANCGILNTTAEHNGTCGIMSETSQNVASCSVADGTSQNLGILGTETLSICCACQDMFF